MAVMEVDLDSPQLLTGLIVYTWAGAALCVGVGIGRYGVRWHFYRRLLFDDVLHMFTVLLVIGMTVARTFQLQWRLEDVSMDATGGQQTTGNSLDGSHTPRDALIVSTVNTSFFWAAVFASKVLFLLVLRHVFVIFHYRAFPGFTLISWLVTLVTLIAWLIAFLSTFWVCGSPSNFLSQEDGTVCVGNEFRHIAIIAWVTDLVTYPIAVIPPLILLSTGGSDGIRAKLRMAITYVLVAGAIVSSVLTWYFADFAPRSLPVTSLDSAPLSGANLASTMLYLEALLMVLASGLVGYHAPSTGNEFGPRPRPEYDAYGGAVNRRDPQDTMPDVEGGGRHNIPDIVVGRHSRTAGKSTGDRFSGTESGTEPGGAGAAGAGAGMGAGAAGHAGEGTENESENVATGIQQFIHLDVPSTNRSYWQIPGLRTSTRTTEWPLTASP